MKNNVTKVLIGIALMFTAGASYSELLEYLFSTDTPNFSGQLDIVYVDNVGTVYHDVPIGTEFYVEIDRVAANGFITDGTTLTQFGCCPGGSPIFEDDEILDASDVALLNSLAGTTSFFVGGLVDEIIFEGQEPTSGGGIIEIGVLYVLDSDGSHDNYPPDPDHVLMTLFFIGEDDDQGVELYAGYGVVDCDSAVDSVDSDCLQSVPLLLRRNDNGRWFRYALNGSTIAAADSVPLTSNLNWDVEAVSDFDGDGEVDVLIRQQDNGRWFLYLMNGEVVLASSNMAIAESLNWQLVAVTDFNNDGMTDLLLRNQANGRWRMYLMDGLSVLQTELVNLPGGLVWDTFAGGDFDLVDDFGDVLLQRSDNGRWRVYRFNADGLTVLETALVGLAENAVWEFQSAADFNGDGTLDVLLRRTDNGFWRLYFMNGTTVLLTDLIGLATNANWKLESASDFNGDGRADALLHNTATNVWRLYLLDSTSIDASEVLSIPASAALELQAVADFDFDGNKDILIRNVNNGRWFVYTVVGTTVTSSTNVSMTNNLVWSIVAPELH